MFLQLRIFEPFSRLDSLIFSKCFLKCKYLHIHLQNSCINTKNDEITSNSMLYNIFLNFVSDTFKYIFFVLIFGLPEKHACLVYFVKILPDGLDPQIHLEFIGLNFIFYSLSQFQVSVYPASQHYQILIIYIYKTNLLVSNHHIDYQTPSSQISEIASFSKSTPRRYFLFSCPIVNIDLNECAFYINFEGLALSKIDFPSLNFIQVKKW